MAGRQVEESVHSSFGAGLSSERFNLLLLEDGEYYFRDHACYYWKERRRSVCLSVRCGAGQCPQELCSLSGQQAGRQRLLLDRRYWPARNRLTQAFSSAVVRPGLKCQALRVAAETGSSQSWDPAASRGATMAGHSCPLSPSRQCPTTGPLLCWGAGWLGSSRCAA